MWPGTGLSIWGQQSRNGVLAQTACKEGDTECGIPCGVPCLCWPPSEGRAAGGQCAPSGHSRLTSLAPRGLPSAWLLGAVFWGVVRIEVSPMSSSCRTGGGRHHWCTFISTETP